jgi:hypothetical protein
MTQLEFTAWCAVCFFAGGLIGAYVMGMLIIAKRGDCRPGRKPEEDRYDISGEMEP